MQESCTAAVGVDVAPHVLQGKAFRYLGQKERTTEVDGALLHHAAARKDGEDAVVVRQIQGGETVPRLRAECGTQKNRGRKFCGRDARQRYAAFLESGDEIRKGFLTAHQPDGVYVGALDDVFLQTVVKAKIRRVVFRLLTGFQERDGITLFFRFRGRKRQKREFGFCKHRPYAAPGEIRCKGFQRADGTGGALFQIRRIGARRVGDETEFFEVRLSERQVMRARQQNAVAVVDEADRGRRPVGKRFGE